MNEKQRPEILVHLFWVFFKSSSLTFAGGLAMLPAIQKDLVDQRKMLKKDDFIEAAALSQTLPGMVVLNCAVFIGSDCAGFPGALVAGFGAILPAFVSMLLATVFFSYLPKGEIVQGLLSGIRLTSAALILHTGITMGKHILKNAFAIAVMLAAFICVFFFNINAFPAMLLALAAGFFRALYALRKKGKKGGRLR